MRLAFAASALSLSLTVGITASRAATGTAPAPAPAVAPTPSDFAAKHAKRTACLKQAKEQRLVSSARDEYVKNCMAH